MNLYCLIVDKMHESLLPMLKAIDVKAVYKPAISRKEIIKLLVNFDGLIIRSKTVVNKNLIEKAAKLKFVAKAGSGVDNLDINYLNSKSISIINAPEGNRDAVGEHTLGLILALLHNLEKGHSQIKNGIWDREGNRGQELKNKTVGIIGYGNMGSAVAKKLSSFGCKVIAYDKYHPNFSNTYAKSVSLQKIKDNTDILSLHIPLTNETLNLTSGDFFFQFKKNILFINTSRGKISSLKSIANAIKKGKIIKAGLDVLENENIDNLNTSQQKQLNYLKLSNKVIFTPHVAGWTTESYIRINEVLVEKIKNIFLTNQIG